MATDPVQDVQHLTNSVQNLAIDPGQQVEDIINHIEFRSGVSHASPAVVRIQPVSDIFVPEHEIDVFFESEAQEAIKMYLRGSGHPENPTIRAFVGDTRFASERPDPLLRARLFLRSVTGDEVIQRDGHSPRVPVIEMHACFAHCTITINESVRNLLNEGAPYHMFQVWLHSAVMDMEEYYDYM
ncbi:hypothetical protein K466DRAFT_605166 [Polyporus arcularius HHB13444]|uniref:Uncharacterized protein n=1 Tax=Polyporus arcularius HHB13444 TaxID=1314778 RepID=A0A5C3NTH8_9APHY|nr:hypothetical protein K466DRAFT_605166 [Polyporus arcularius HHB13444]